MATRSWLNNSEEDAEILVRDFAIDWVARKAFCMGVFLKNTRAFVAQIYVGVVNWDLPEFEIGYFVEKDHQGQGYITEATQGALHFCFGPLGAARVSLKCADTNVCCFRVADRCGMVREGHLRENKKDADGVGAAHCFTGYYGVNMKLREPDATQHALAPDAAPLRCVAQVKRRLLRWAGARSII